MMSSDRVLAPGRNCWRVERATRAAFLVEGAEYYPAFRDAVTRAQRRIFIVGWDIDSNLRLLRDDGDNGGPLGDFLNGIVSSRPELEAYVLIWDFAMLYAMEREWLPVYRLGWKTHRRLHFRLDDRHPLGGSQHQKVVVIDDEVAFVGGMDLSKWRWDTSEHAPGDPRRRDSAGNRYSPYHDVQMLVSGPAAVALGELVRERWHRATGHALSPPEPVGDPWPQTVVPSLTGVEVAIARTEPRYAGRREVREVERLYLDMIARARHYIYVENQYLTSKVIGDALASRLREAHGPDMVLVVPQKTGGWLEQNTMDVLRRRIVRQLRGADRHGRLRLVYPHVPGLEPQHISVHSKLMVVDDRLVRVGSANLSNRSMGLDSECDLCLESDEPAAASAARALLARLLGEHLDVDEARFHDVLAETGSLVRTVDALAGDGRSLRPLDENGIRVEPEVEVFVSESDLVDPERPVDPERLAARVVPQDDRQPARRGITVLMTMLFLLLALAAGWRWTPLNQWLDVDTLVALFDALQQYAYGPLAVLAGYVIGGFLVVPVTLLVAVTIIAFGPVWGFAYALVGSLLSAAAVFGAGHLLGRNTVRRLAGSRLNRLSQRLARRGVLAIITVRIIPVAPFTVVNLVAGVSHISFGKYMLGTVIGMVPGLLGLSVFMDRLLAAIRSPDTANLALVAAAVLLLAAGGFGLRRWLQRSGRRRAIREPSG